MKWLRNGTVIRACQIVIGVLFAWSGLGKLGGPAATLAGYGRVAKQFFENLSYRDLARSADRLKSRVERSR